MSAVIDTEFEINGVDISNIFQSINSTQGAETGLIAPNGADLNTLFEPYTYGTVKAISVKYDANNIDLNTLFNRMIAYGAYTETQYLSTSVTVLQPSSYIRIFKFLHSGKFTIKESLTLHYLIVGGGGGGSASYPNHCSGAGGSGGQVICGSTTITPGTYTVTVGSGGTGGKTDGGLALSGKDGTASSFLSFTAEGGKGGIGINGTEYIYNTSSYSLVDRIKYAVTSTGGSTNGGISAAGGNSAINYQNVITSTANIGAKGTSYVSSTLNPIIASDNTTFFSIFGNGGNSGYATHFYTSSNATSNTGNGGDGASISTTVNPGYNGGSGVVYLGYTLPTENVNITGTNPVVTNFFAYSKTQTSVTLKYEGNFFQVDISYNGYIFKQLSTYSLTINNLSYNTKYTFYISPYDLLYHKLYTNATLSLSVVTLPYLANMKYIANLSSDSTVVITWSGSYSYGILTNNITGNRTYISSSTFSFTSTELLLQGTDYPYTLTVYNSTGDSVSSTVETYTESTVPIISGLSYISTTNSITLFWGGNYISATLYNETTNENYDISGYVVSFTDSNKITPGKQYNYTVKIMNSYGNYATASIVTYSIPNIENATFDVNASQPHYVVITWNSNNYSYITIQNITVQDSVVTTLSSDIGEYVSLQYEILSANTEYTYKLIAYNAAHLPSETVYINTFTLPEIVNLGYTSTINSIIFQWEKYYSSASLEFDGVIYDITNTTSFTVPYELPANTSYVTRFYLYHTANSDYGLNKTFVTVYTLPMLSYISYITTTNTLYLDISGEYNMISIENKTDGTENVFYDASINFQDTLTAGKTYNIILNTYNLGCYQNSYPITVCMKPELYSIAFVDDKSTSTTICLRWTSYATHVNVVNNDTNHTETVTEFTFPYTYFQTTESLSPNTTYTFTITAYNDNDENVVSTITAYTFPNLDVLTYNVDNSTSENIFISWSGNYDKIELQNVITQTSYTPSSNENTYESTEQLTSSTAYRYNFTVYKITNHILNTYLRSFYNIVAHTLPSTSDFAFSYSLFGSTTTSVQLMWRNKGYFTVTISMGVSAIDTVNNGLSLYYPFDSNFADYSVNGIQGTTSTSYSGNIGIARSDIKYGSGCLYILEGSLQIEPYIPTNSQYMTIAFWMKSNRSKGDSRIFDFGTSNIVSSESIFMTPNGFLSDQGNTNNLFVGCIIQDTEYYWQTNLTINDDVWRHFVLSIEFTDSSITFYLYMNGEALTYPNDTYTIPISYNFGFERPYCYLGAPPNGVSSSNAFYGKLDDFRVYNRLLSLDEINTLYTMSVYRTYTSASNITHYNSLGMNTLTVNSSYNYTAIIKNKYGSVAYSTITAYTLPTITDASYSATLDTVTIYWTGIYSNIKITLNETFQTFDASNNACSFTNLTAGQSYICYIRAYNGDIANNVYYEQVLDTYTIPTLTDISYNPNYSSSDYIFISWNAGTFHHLTIQLEGSSTITTIYSTSGINYYTSIGIDVLEPNTEYIYHITGYNAISNSSDTISLLTYTKPIITNAIFNQTISNNGSINISWNGKYNYGTIKNTTTGTINNITSSQTLFTSSEYLESNTHYIYELTVYGVHNTSVSVNIDAYTFATIYILSTPTTSYTVSINWDGSYNYGVINFYGQQNVVITSETNTYTFTNLQPNTSYLYSITVYNNFDFPSTTMSIVTTEKLPTVEIYSTSITSYTTTITVSGEFYTGYILLNDISSSELVSLSPVIYNGLIPNSTYSYSVHVFNMTLDSSVIYNTITTALLPTVSVTKVTSNKYSVTIYYTGNYVKGFVQLSGQPDVYIKDINTYTPFANLSPNTTYYYTINVYNATNDLSSTSGSITTYPTINVSTISTTSYTATLSLTGAYTLCDLSMNNTYTRFTGSSITISGLSPNQTFPYMIIAYSSDITKYTSTKGNFTTKSLPNVTIRSTSKTSTSITITWLGNYNNGTIVMNNITKTFDASTYTSSFTNLTPNTTYSYVLTVYNSTNDSYSVTDSITIYPTLVTPTISTTATTVTANWGGLFTEGIITITNNATLSFTSSTLSTTFSRLTPNKMYTYSIIVKNAVGDTASYSGSFTTKSLATVSISSITPTSNKVTIFWTGSYDSGYVLFDNTVMKTFSKFDTPSKEFTSLSPNTSYTYEIGVYNSTNDKTTITGTVVTLPTFSLESITKTSFSITFNWSGIYTSGILIFGTTSVVLDNTMTSYTFRNLISGSEYKYYITVYNSVKTTIYYNGSITFSGSESTANLPTILLKPPSLTSYTSTLNWIGTYVNGTITFQGKPSITFTYPTNSYLITDLSANTKYSYTIFLYNSTGDSISASSSLTTASLPYAKVNSCTTTAYTATINWTGIYSSASITINNITKTLTSNQRSSTFTSLTPNTIYQYTLSVANSSYDVVSYTSSFVTATLPTVTITSIETSSYTAVVNWTGSYSSISYVFKGLTVSTGSNSRTFTSLTPSTTYSVSLIASNSVGDTITKTASFTTLALPTLSVSSYTSTSYTATLYWSGSYTSGTITVTGASSTISITSSTTTATITNLTPNSTRTYTITYVNSKGDAATTTGTITTKPLPTLILSSSTVTSYTATISWSGVYTSGTITFNNSTTTISSDTLSYTVSSLTPSTSYTYSITVSNSTGDTITKSSSLTTAALPTLSVTSISTSCYAAKLVWSGTYSLGIITVNGSSYSFASDVNTKTLYGLLPSTTYTYLFTLYNSTSNSATITGTFTTTSLPSINVTSTSSSAYTITLNWSGVYTSGSLLLNTKTYTITSSQVTSYTFTNLQANTSYRYTFLVRNATGDSVTITDIVSTAALPSITTTSTSSTAYTSTINWTGSYTTGTLTINKVTYDISNLTSYTIANLTASSSYSYSFTVYNSTGDSSTYYNSITTKDLPTLSITGTSTSSYTATITWSGTYSTGNITINNSTTSITSSQTSLTVYSLSANTKYTYTVVIYNSTGDKVTLSGTFTTIALPTVTVTSTSTTSYKATISIAGTFASGYLKLNNVTQNLLIKSSYEYKFYNLSPNKTYVYNLQVKNSAGDTITTTGSVTTVALPTVAISSKSYTTTTVTVNWSGTYTTGTLSINGISYTISSSSSTMTISNLIANTTYAITITVYNDTGDSVSVSDSITTSPTLTIVSAVATTTTVTITWAGRFSTGTIMLNNTMHSFTSDTVSYTYTDLTSNTNYTYVVLVNSESKVSIYKNGTVTTMLFPGQLFYYKFNTADISGNLIANYACGSAVYTSSTTSNTNAISSYRYKSGNGSFFPYMGYINLPTFSFSNLGVTISFWFYFSLSVSVGDQLQVFDFGNGSYKYNYTCRIYTYGSTERIYTDLFMNTNGLSMWNYSSTACLTTSYSPGTWCHITIVSSENTWTYYYNGALAYTQTNVYYPSSVTRSAAVIGYSYANNTNSVSGFLDEFRVFNTPLTSDEVATLYSAS